MKKLLYISLILFTACYQSKSPDLQGHFHITALDTTLENYTVSFPTLDFEGDSVVVLGKHILGSDGIMGYHDPKQQELYLGGECIYFHFSYEWKDTSLILTLQEDGQPTEQFLAWKCDGGCCDKQAEFFFGFPIQIDLPKIKSDIAYDSTRSRSLEKPFYFGVPNPNLQSDYGDSIRMVVREKFVTTEDLELYDEIIAVKIPESRRNRIYKVIYADKHTPMHQLAPLIQHYEEMGESRFYIALRNQDISKRLMPYYVPFNFDTISLSQINNLTIEQFVQR